MSGHIGWISLHRKLMDNTIYNHKPFDMCHAWIDILLNVNHESKKVLLGNEIFVCERGASLYSLDTWASRWGWNKSKVRRFLILLQNDNMIVLKGEHKTTRLTVVNYNTYQNIRNADETTMKRERNADETLATPNNNINNGNNGINENKISFDEARKLFKGDKRGLDTEYDNFTKKNKDWKLVLPLLKPAIQNLIEHKKHLIQNKEFCAPWPAFQVWINQRRWETELSKPVPPTPKINAATPTDPYGGKESIITIRKRQMEEELALQAERLKKDAERSTKCD